MRPEAKGSRISIARALLAAVLPLVLAVMAGGCPGTLDNPERFLDGGGSYTCPDVVGELFVKSCGGSICHEGAEPAAGLDLVAPGVIERLVDQKGRDCPGILVDPVLPESSLMYQKLLALPDCGSPMPLGRPAFTVEELECVRDWIAAQ